MGFKKGKETEYEKRFVKYIEFEYQTFLKLISKPKVIKKYIEYENLEERYKQDNTEINLKNIRTKLLKHTEKLINKEQRQYIHDLDFYCSIFNVTPNDMLIGENLINTDESVKEFVYFFNEHFEEDILKIKAEGKELLKSNKGNIIILPLAVHIFTGTTLYAKTNLTIIDNDIEYFISFFEYEHLTRAYCKLNEKEKLSTYMKLKKIIPSDKKRFLSALEIYRKYCDYVLTEHHVSLLEGFKKVTTFLEFKKLVSSNHYLTKLFKMKTDK